MALRVLLADESSTIKKAIQLVLADYGVEVKTVPTGIDVMAVALTYKPDIVIADILLNKKNGYEVCTELKNNESTKTLPVILMWSNFMQLDENLFHSSRADASIEKPFETDTLRALIEKHVPKLKTFPLKGFLKHAPLPDFEESETFIRQKNDYNTLNSASNNTNTNTKTDTDITNFGTTAQPSPPAAEPASHSNTNTTAPYALDDTSLTKKRVVEKSVVTSAEDDEPHSQTNSSPSRPDEWSSSKTNQFVIETENFGDFEEVKIISSSKSNSPDLQKKINEQIQNYIKDAPVAIHKAQNSLNQKTPQSSFDEQLMREEIRQITERVCWQIIPELTEKIVREELNKLLQGIENNI